jgi:hypothetical protein
MKHKVGDKVRIKSVDWYEQKKDGNDHVDCGEVDFVKPMSEFCGNIYTIIGVINNIYALDCCNDKEWAWTDDMFE